LRQEKKGKIKVVEKDIEEFEFDPFSPDGGG
jgi:hypothetical protein